MNGKEVDSLKNRTEDIELLIVRKIANTSDYDGNVEGKILNESLENTDLHHGRFSITQ